MEILDQGDHGIAVGTALDDAADHVVDLALAGCGVHGGRRAVRIGDAEEVEEDGQRVAVALVEEQQPPRDLLARGAVVVVVGDAEVLTEGLEHWQDRFLGLRPPRPGRR